MSNILPPLVIPTGDTRNSKFAPGVSLPPLSSWSDGYRALDSIGSSSPPRSSSPPMTPFSSKSSQSYAYIQSSPRIAYETGHHPHSDHMDDHPSAWDRSYMHYPKSQPSIIPHTLPSTKSTYDGEVMFRATPPLYMSRPSEKMELDFGGKQTEMTGDVATRYPSTFYDSEEEHEDEDDSEGYSFVEEGARATFFRTSAERGQWRTDPAALKLQSRWQMRQSAPTWSPPPVPGLQLVPRPISEPARSTSRVSSPADFPDSHDEQENPSELPCSPPVGDMSPDHPNHVGCDLPNSLPSLISDREPSHEPEEVPYPSSPLPPSSPPLSPASLPVSPMMRSISPLSFASSPAFLPPSSPLSFPPSDQDYESTGLGEGAESDGALPGAPSGAGLTPAVLDFEPSVCIEASLSPPVPAREADVCPASAPEPVTLSPMTTSELESADKDQSPEPALDVPTSSDLPEKAGEVEIVALPADISSDPEPSVDYYGGEDRTASSEEMMDVDFSSNQLTEGTQIPDVPTLFGSTIIEVQPPEVPVVEKVTIEEASEISAAIETKIDVPNVLDLFDDPVEASVPLESSETGTLAIPESSTNATSKPRVKTKVDKALKVRDHNGATEAEEKGEGPSHSVTSAGKQKRKKVEEERRPEGPARKKSRSAAPETTSSELMSSSAKGKFKAVESQTQKKGKTDGKRKHEEEDETLDAGPQPEAKKHRKNNNNTSKSRPRQVSHGHSDSSTASSASSSKRPPTAPGASPQKPKSRNPEMDALDAEICGLLIESMATSRASCLPASSLCKLVMQCRPSLKAQRSEKEWMEVFERVLRNGEASRGSGVFGKVESSGKDDSDRPLEAQWFYVPEADDDQERAALIKSMMPRPGKRSETKKYKQYYYRPLEKISRWDPEDEI